MQVMRRSGDTGARKQHRRGRLCAFALLCVLAVVPRLSAQCSPDSSLYLLLHTTLRNLNWMPAFNGYEVTVPDTMCALDPVSVSMIIIATIPLPWSRVRPYAN